MSGIMLAIAGCGPLNDAILIAQVTGTTSSPTPASLGSLAGDMAIAVSDGGISSGSGGSWTAINSGAGHGSAFYRILNSADLAAPINSTGVGNLALMILRGATSLQSVVTDGGIAPVPHLRTVAGFTRAPNHAGLVSYNVNTTQTAGTPATTPAVITAPTLFTSLTIPTEDFSGTRYVSCIAYRLAPAATPYVNGTSFTYGDGLSSGNQRTQYLNVLELLR